MKWVQLAGLVLEIAGVLLMARGFTGVASWWSLPGILLDALRRGDKVWGTAAIGALEPEDEAARQRRDERNRRDSLQGLALVGLGFLVQAAGLLTLGGGPGLAGR